LERNVDSYDVAKGVLSSTYSNQYQHDHSDAVRVRGSVTASRNVESLLSRWWKVRNKIIHEPGAVDYIDHESFQMDAEAVESLCKEMIARDGGERVSFSQGPSGKYFTNN
jgi:hypothetical protein